MLACWYGGVEVDVRLKTAEEGLLFCCDVRSCRSELNSFGPLTYFVQLVRRYVRLLINMEGKLSSTRESEEQLSCSVEQ